MFNYLTLNYIISLTSIKVVFNIIIITKITYSLQSTNNYKYWSLLTSLIVIILINFFNKTQLYLFIFILLTELTSMYLVLVITLNVNSFKKKTNNWNRYLLIFLILNYYSFTHQYYYFDYYNVTYLSNFSGFLILFIHYYYLWIIFLILTLTVFILLLLNVSTESKKTNLIHLLSGLKNFINQIPLNLNLHSTSILKKWK